MIVCTHYRAQKKKNPGTTKISAHTIPAFSLFAMLKKKAIPTGKTKVLNVLKNLPLAVSCQRQKRRGREERESSHNHVGHETSGICSTTPSCSPASPSAPCADRRFCLPKRVNVSIHSNQEPLPFRFDTRSRSISRNGLGKPHLDFSQNSSYAASSKSVSGTSSVILTFMNQPLPMGSSLRMPGVSVNDCARPKKRDG